MNKSNIAIATVTIILIAELILVFNAGITGLQTFDTQIIISNGTIPNIQFAEDTNYTLNIGQYFIDLEGDALYYSPSTSTCVAYCPENLTFEYYRGWFNLAQYTNKSINDMLVYSQTGKLYAAVGNKTVVHDGTNWQDFIESNGEVHTLLEQGSILYIAGENGLLKKYDGASFPPTDVSNNTYDTFLTSVNYNDQPHFGGKLGKLVKYVSTYYMINETQDTGNITTLQIHKPDGAVQNYIYIGRDNGKLGRYNPNYLPKYAALKNFNSPITAIAEFAGKIYIGLGNGTLYSVTDYQASPTQYTNIAKVHDKITSMTVFENKLYISGKTSIKRYNGTIFENVLKDTIYAENYVTLNITVPLNSTHNTTILYNQTNDINILRTLSLSPDKIYTGTLLGEIDVYNGTDIDYVRIIPDKNYNDGTSTGQSMRFYATDNKTSPDQRQSNSFTIKITSVNDLPTFTGYINNTEILEDTNYTIHVYDYFTDVEDAQKNLTFSLNVIMPQTSGTFTSKYNKTKGNLTIIPKKDYDQYGKFKITVTDRNGGTAQSNEFIIAITPQIDTIIESSNASSFTNLTWYENTDQTLNLSQYYYAESPEIEILYGIGDENCYNLTLNVTQDHQGLYLFTPDPNWHGMCTVNLTIDDVQACNGTQHQLDLIVLNVPDAPVFNTSRPLLNYTWKEDKSIKFNISGMFYIMPGYEFDYSLRNPNLLLFCQYDNAVNCSHGELPLYAGNITYSTGRYYEALKITNKTRLSYYLNHTLQEDFNTTQGTIILWVNYDWNVSQPTNYTLLDFRNKTGIRGFVIEKKLNKLRFTWVNETTSQNDFIETNWTLERNEWNQITITYKKQTEGTHQVAIYLDGKLQISDNTMTNYPQQFSFETLHVGVSANNTDHFMGLIDDLTIFNYPLPLKKIKDHYNYKYPFIYIQRYESATETYNLTSWENWWGTQPAIIYATDAEGNINNSNIALFNVTSVNDAPELVSQIPNQTWKEDTTPSVLNLSQYFIDVDEDEINYSVIGNDSISVSINQTSKIVTFNSDLNYYGAEYVYFIATDGKNTTYSNKVYLIVEEVNEIPTIYTFTPASPTNYTIPIKFVIYDEEGDLTTVNPYYNIGGGWKSATGTSLSGLITNLPPLDVSATKDTYVDELYPTTNYGTSTVIQIGTDGLTRKLRAMIKFDLPAIPYYLVKEAKLKLLQVYAVGADKNIGVYETTQDWQETGATFNNQPAFGTLVSSTLIDDTLETKEFNITTIVKQWLNGTKTNNGLILKQVSEGATTGIHSFASNQYQGANLPVLEITYSGIEYTFNWDSIADINNTDQTARINFTIADYNVSATTGNITVLNNHPIQVNETTTRNIVMNEDETQIIDTGAYFYDIDPYQKYTYTFITPKNLTMRLQDDVLENSFSVTTAYDYQGSPDVDIDSLNQRYIVWEDRVFTNSIISMGIYSDANVLQKLEYLDASTKPQLKPKIKINDYNYKYIVWEDARKTKKAVYLAVYDNSDTKIKLLNLTNTSSVKEQKNPDLAVYNFTTYVIYGEVEPTTSQSNIILQQLTGYGSKQQRTKITTQGNNTKPALVVDNRNNKYIFWIYNGNQIKYRTVNTTYNNITNTTQTNLGSILNLTTSATEKDSPAATIDSRGITHITWVERNQNMNYLYYAQLNKTTILLNKKAINDTTNRFNPDIQTNKYNAVYIPHEKGVDEKADIYYLKLNKTGSIIYNRALTTDSVRQSNPAIAIEPNSKKIIIWQYGNDNDNIEGIQLSDLTGEIEAVPSQDYYGNLSAIIIASDQFSNANLTLNFTILPINDAPYLVGLITQIDVPEEGYNDTMTLTGLVVDVDSPNFTWTALSVQDLNITINSTSFALNLTAITPNATGIRTAIFTVTDGYAATNMTVIINITNVNDKPVLNKTIPYIAILKNQNATLELSDYFVDIDGDTLVYNAILVQNLTITINSTSGKTIIVPDTNFTGTRIVKFSANDTFGEFVTSNNVSVYVLHSPNIIFESTINGTAYNGTYYFINNIFYSKINYSTILNTWYINDSTIIRTTINDSTTYSSTINDSTLTNSQTTSCIITNSNLKNYAVNNCIITDSTLDPTTLYFVNNSNITGDSTILYSNITDSDVNNSQITSSTIHNSQIKNSEINNCDTHGSTILSAEIADCTAINAIINGSMLLNGTLNTQYINYNATLSGPANITDLINLAPSASFVASKTEAQTGEQIQFTDQSTDPNIPGLLGDFLTYTWKFGDGANSATANPTHTYNTAGDYVVELKVKDKYNKTSTFVRLVRISSPAGGGGGGGGGGGSGSYCNERWICDDWYPQPCPEQQLQGRVCYDANECGTENNKPNTLRECQYETAPVVEEPLSEPTVPIVEEPLPEPTPEPEPISEPELQQPTKIPTDDGIKLRTRYIMVAMAIFALAILIGIGGIRGYQYVTYKVSFAGRVETIERKVTMLMGKGKDKKSIRTDLTKQGYDPAIINYAFEELDYTGVEEWAEKAIAGGYLTETLKRQLKMQNYDAKEINTIMKRVDTFNKLKKEISARIAKKQKKKNILNDLYKQGYSKMLVNRAVKKLIEERRNKQAEEKTKKYLSKKERKQKTNNTKEKNNKATSKKNKKPNNKQNPSKKTNSKNNHSK